MGICRYCKKEMMDSSVTSCEGNPSIEFPDGQSLQRVRYNPKTLHLPAWFRCPDCNIVPGGIHHSNCDQEICPKCSGQLISCACFDDDNQQGAD